MEKVVEILEEIEGSIDYWTVDTLIDDGYFDSFAIIQTINALKEEFDIEIPATEIIPENFNSAKGLWEMVCRIQDED